MKQSTLYLTIFFYQAEDGIRDTSVTGVQTCALPILSKDINMRIKAHALGLAAEDYYNDKVLEDADLLYTGVRHLPTDRSEERRVGKEGGSLRLQVTHGKRSIERQMVDSIVD